jgi:hypothetical protein
MNQLKREASQRLEENIERELREERERRLTDDPEKKMVVVREKFDQIDLARQQKQEDFDYENLIDVEEQDDE